MLRTAFSNSTRIAMHKLRTFLIALAVWLGATAGSFADGVFVPGAPSISQPDGWNF